AATAAPGVRRRPRRGGIAIVVTLTSVGAAAALRLRGRVATAVGASAAAGSIGDVIASIISAAEAKRWAGSVAKARMTLRPKGGVTPRTRRGVAGGGSAPACASNGLVPARAS